KGFYFTFFGVIGLSIVQGFIEPSNWALLLQLAAVAIFIDLTLFQTPGISKIWNTELNKEEHSLKKLIENNRLVSNNSTKALEFHEVIANDIFSLNSPQNWEEYKEIILNYYSEYTKELNLSVHLIELEVNQVDNVYNKLDEAFEKSLRYHSVQALKERKKKNYVTRLRAGKQVKIESTLEETIVFIPFFGAKYGFLLSVLGKGEIEANEIDAMYLLNIAYIN